MDKNPQQEQQMENEQPDMTAQNEKAAEEASQTTETQEEPPSTEELMSQLDEARRQAEEYLDNWRRTAAEFQNFRKRKEREMQEFEQRANERLILKLLPVLDDFHRALANVPEELKEHDFVKGIELIERKFWGVLEQEGVTPIESSPGTPFDPAEHEALLSEEHDEFESGQIIEEYQRGYKHRGRVIRPARVRVAQ
nr:nucleotide exchange factor GrpE [Ardenticatena sp.]